MLSFAKHRPQVGVTPSDWKIEDFGIEFGIQNTPTDANLRQSARRSAEKVENTTEIRQN